MRFKSRRRSLRRWKTFNKLESRRKSLLRSRPTWKDYSEGWDSPKPWKPCEFEVKNPSCFTWKTAGEKAWEEPTRKRRMRNGEREAIREYERNQEDDAA